MSPGLPAMAKTAGLLLVSRTFTPPAGACAGSVTVIPSSRFCPTAALLIPIVPNVAAVTVTLSVVSGILTPLTWIVVEPTAWPVTGTLTEVAPEAKVTVDGAVATPVLLELTLTVRPAAGAFAERTSGAFGAGLRGVIDS